MGFFLFGKKKRRSKRKVSKKPPAAILRKCKKLKIKCTLRKGGRRVYRKVSVLKKLISKKMKKRMHRKKAKKTHRRRRTRRTRRTVRFGFGFGSAFPRRSRFGEAGAFSNSGPGNYGYNQAVVQKPGILSQSSQMVPSVSANDARPTGLGLPGEYVPTYGVYRPFFGENVPTQVGPNWNFMGQPDGTSYAVGGPFARFTAPAAFGRHRGYRGYFGRDGCGMLKKMGKNGKCVFKGTKQKEGTAEERRAAARANLDNAGYGRRGYRGYFGRDGCGGFQKMDPITKKCVLKSVSSLAGNAIKRTGKIAATTVALPLAIAQAASGDTNKSLLSELYKEKSGTAKERRDAARAKYGRYRRRN